MFDSFSGSRPARMNEDFDASLQIGGGSSGSDSSFGAIASYQVCACCARFHGATTAADGGGGPYFGLNADDRGVFGPNGKPSLSSTDAGAQITRTNQSWAAGLGTAATVTYAFRDSVTTMPTDTAGFSQFSAVQIAATLQALTAWSDVANITFQRVQDVGSEYSNNATILLGNYSSGQDGAAAFAYLPGGMPGSTGASQVQGDVWINSSLSYNAVPTQLGYGQLTLLHELGHAIGLSHPAAYNASSGGVITYAASAIYYEDSLQYSVMSYFNERETGADFRTDGTGTRRYASAPLLDDISASQRLYGANMTTRTGDTVYGFNSTAGRIWYGATNELSPLVFCAWDAGGTDTFDFSGYFNNGQIIDLRQGAFTSVGGLVGNVSIALGAVIENAIGGLGSDTFRGNSVGNRFTLNSGDDVVDGGLGSDTVVFSGTRATYTVSWNGQIGTVTGNGQTVTVTNVEFLQFTDQTIAATPTGGLVVGGDITNETITGSALADVIGGLGGTDTIDGLAGNDNLNGGSGDDTLNGGDDDDILIGALGNDALDGGAGTDLADYSGAGAGVTVNLTNGSASGGAGFDTLSNVEDVTGTAFNDSLTGDDNANVLRGGGGIDTLGGGGGDDQLFAGAPGQGGGAPDIVKGSDTFNNTIGTAVSLAGAFDLFSDASIANSTTIPHATVDATTHGGVEYYSITVTAGETVIFDIDGASFDSTLRLMTGAGDELANNDDNGSDGGDSTDSMLTHTFASAGTYYIQVGRWLSNVGETFTSGAPPAGGTYRLHVSSPSQAPVPVVQLGSTLNGEAGEDQLEGGAGADTLNGGSDNDLLTGGAGNDTINGGGGSLDVAVFSGNRAAYTVSVSGGVTTVSGPDGTDSLTNVERLQFADQTTNAAGDPLDGAINGTGAADALNGDGGANTINGLGGDDVITGGAGNDTIDGGSGTDTAVFSGERAGYTVSTVGGTTTVTGPDGTDTLTTVERLQFSDVTLIVGAGGGQYIVGTGGPDTIGGTDFADEILAGAGDDAITGGTGNDAIDGGDGTDTAVFAGERAGYTVSTVGGTTTVTGPDGTDTITTVERLQFTDVTLIVGAGGGQYVVGTGGADTIGGTDFDDEILAGAGDDAITGGTGNDAIDGGDGTDTAVFAGERAGYTISTTGGVTTVTGPDGTDTLTNVEQLQFSDGLYDLAGDLIDDSINGTSGPDTLDGDGTDNTINGLDGDDILGGAGGNDTLNGGAGDDVLDGGAGNDALNGGDGVDTVSYASASAGATVQLAKTNDQNTIGAGRDTLSSIENLTGSAFRDYFTGDAGDNVLSDTLGGNDRFIGGAGNDTLSIERSGNGAATEVTLTGGIGDDTMTFNGNGRYTDTVVFEGQDGNDVISATGAFKANVNGGAGNDTVTVDTLGGSFVVKLGSGSDTLVLAGTDGGFGGSAANIVRDFVAGAGGDIIDLTAYLAGGALTNYTPGDNPFLDGHMRLVQAGADTLVQIDRDGGSDGFVTVMTLQKTFASNFTAFNFNGLAPLPAPVEGGAGVDSLTGTEGIDVLNGNGGNDSLVGLAGADVLNGGAGNDVLDGGDGDDVLNGGSGGQGDTATYATASAGVNVNLGLLGLQNTGGSGFDSLTGIEHLVGSAFTDELRGDAAANQLTDTLGGNDFLRGEAGNDTLLITRSGGGAATTVRLNGGADNDALTFTGNGRFSDTVTLEGEAGNDVITVSGALTINIDAGTGDDTIIYDTLGGVHRMTLGTGVDTVRLADTGGLFQASGDNLVRDFTTGVGGDIVDLTAYLAGGALTNYTGGDNPFGDGHMRLVQSGSRTLLQVDRDGGGDGYQTVLAFANTTVASFTTANFNGFDPTGAVPAPVEGSDKDGGPQVLPVGSDDFLVLPAGPDTDGPQVLPGELIDSVPVKAGLFDFDRTAPFERVIGEDGVVTNGWDHRDHGQDDWLF